MTRLGVRTRLALLSALLVAAVGTSVAAGGYLTFRGFLLGQAGDQARAQARQLAGLVDVRGAPHGGDAQANLVDIGDPSLSHGFARDGLLVRVERPDGAFVQASRDADSLRAPPAVRSRCLHAGEAEARLGAPPVALACRRVGPAGSPAGIVLVGAPLRGALDSLARLRAGLGIGLGGGVVIAALASLLVAARALRPARQIAQAAESIRSGDLSRRIGYRGPADELGALANTLDLCFSELEQAAARQRRFVADASHELKTPIAAMRAHVELLRQWAAVDQAAREAALASLDQATRRVGRLGADLLYLTELDRRPPQARVPVALDEVLVSTVREAQPLRSDVAVRIDRLDEAVVMGDEQRLQQLVLNLLDNALRISPSGSEVRLSLESAPSAAVVLVSDAGPGIPPERLDRIFDAFYSRPGPGRAGGGTGLGLAIAREIARAHGGDLIAENSHDGGASFRLTLPLAGRSSNSHRHLIEA